MRKKVLSVLLALFLCFSFSLQAFALTEEQEWMLTYQMQDLPEEYRELYVIVPDGAYHSEETVTVENVKYGDWGYGPEGVLIQELFDAGVFVKPEKSSNNPEWENNPDRTFAPASEVERVYEETFGPGSFEKFKHKEKNFSNYVDQFRYDAETDRYGYLYRPWGGGIPSAFAYVSFEKAEEIDGTVELYVRYGGYQSVDVSADNIFKLYRDARMRVSGVAEPYYTSSVAAEEDVLCSGVLDEFLPLYKHTFKDNGAGGYYWASTEMVQAENAEQIKAVFASPKDTDTSAPDTISSDTDSPDSSTDSATDTETENTSAEIPIDSGPSEKNLMIAVWVCVGVAAVALVCMFFPVVRKKIKKKEKGES